MTRLFRKFIWYRTKIVSRWCHKICQILTKKKIFHHWCLDVSGSVAGGALDGGVRRCRYSGADTVPSCPTLYRAGRCRTDGTGAFVQLVRHPCRPVMSLDAPTSATLPLNSANNVTQYRPIVSHFMASRTFECSYQVYFAMITKTSLKESQVLSGYSLLCSY